MLQLTLNPGLMLTGFRTTRPCKTVSKMMRLQWINERDIDTLESKGHWATIEELLEVVACYLPRYENVLKTCKDKPTKVSPLEL